MCGDDAPAVREHLHTADLEHRPKLVESAAVALGRDDHAKAWRAHLQTASEHQSVPDNDELSSRFFWSDKNRIAADLPRLEDVEVGGEAWKGELKYEDGGVESGVVFLSIDHIYSFFEGVRI